jgi:A/G-specific adenine glycosylase
VDNSPLQKKAQRKQSAPPPLESARFRAFLRRRLLAWFDANRRDLPWRRSRDPYPIWVSEVMLQQTQVATVIPYFERFLRRFPTFGDLAAADEKDVLLLWEGLGYYRRARDLHKAARRLAAEHAGEIPNDPKRLQDLPGFGRYTCNAVLSQAFDRRLPILEANSQRVLARLLGCEDDPRQGRTRTYLWEKAEQLLPKRRVGDFNQAMMELGALVCTPTSPRCSTCPLATCCEAKASGTQDRIPPRRRQSDVTEVNEAAIIVWKKNRVLLVLRPAAGQWAGLWEFPRGPIRTGESPKRAALRWLRKSTNIEGAVPRELTTLRHGITRYRITLKCFDAEFASGRFRSSFYVRGRWLKPAELANYPVSAPQRRLVKTLANRTHRVATVSAAASND